MSKRAKRICFLLIAGVIGVAGGAVIFVQSSTFEQWLLRRIERMAGEAGYRVRAERLNLNVWHFRASLEKIAVDDGKTASVRVDRLLIDVPWNAFRDGINRVTDLEADGVQIEIRSPEQPSESSRTTEAPRILFDKLAIRNASLIYSDGERTVRIPSFNIEAQNGRGAVRFGSPIAISPDVQISIAALALRLSDQSLDLGPTDWRIDHPGATITGSSRGHLQWSPSLVLNFDYSTKPFKYQNWHGLSSSATAGYENGVLKITDFRLRSDAGMAAGSAEITGQLKSINVLWTAVNLEPAGVPAATDGDLRLRWRASDFSDLSGEGSLLVSSPRYGQARSNVMIRNARADLDIRATALDANLRAKITTGPDQTITGTLQATHSRYGSARLAGTLSGTLRDPRLNGKLTANGLRYEGMGPLNASANASFASRVLFLDEIRLQLKNSEAPRGFVRVDLGTRHVLGEIPEIQVQISDFTTAADGTATLSALVEGTIQKPATRIQGSSNGLNIAGNRIDQIRFTGEADTGGFRLTELTAHQNAGLLSAAGDYNFDTKAISGNARVSDLEINPVADMSATASLTADVGGTFDAPMASFSGRLLNVRYRNEEHGDLDLQGSIQNDIASVRIESAKYGAVGTADVGLKEPYAYTGTIIANRSRITYQQYDVTANGSVQASGDLKPFGADHVRFEDFTVRGPGVDLIASGSLSEGVKLRTTADLSKLPVESVHATGQVRAQAVVSGTLNDPQIEGSLETTNATVRTEAMAEPATIQAAIDFTRNEFAIRRLQAAYAEAIANISGRGTLEGTGQFQFRVESIKPERLFNDRRVVGVIGLEGTVDVAKPNLEGIGGSARVTRLDVTVAGVPVHQVEPVEIRLENQVVTTRNMTIEGLNTRATIAGSADLRTRALDFTVEGNTDLRILESFIPGTNPSGQIRTNVTVRGTPENPKLDGSLSLANMQLQIAEPPISVADTKAQIQLRGDRLQILSASGSMNGGAFTASGGANISPEGLGDTAIELNLAGAQTEYPAGFQSEISSRLSLNGSGSNFEISGNVDVLDGTYRRDIDLAQEVFARITGPAQTALQRLPQQSAMDQIRLNVTVATPGVVSIANNVANFEMDGSFRLRGTIGNPIITGRAGVAEGGEIYFGPQVGATNATEAARRDRYVISEGSIDFNNPIRTEPRFNLVATRELQGKGDRYIITLRASGTPDDFKTELTSDPALDEPNIVALLLTGRTFEDLEGYELLVAQEQAANYLSGRFGNLFQSAATTFRLNTVRVDPVLLAGDADLSAKLTIGKDITPNFNLVYSQNLSGPRAQTWITSYQALQNLLIRGINRSDDNTLTVELRHDLKWGGGPALPKGAKPKDERMLGTVAFEGTAIPTKDLLKQVTKPGKPFNAYRMNDDVRKLQQFFAGRDFLKTSIRAIRNPRDGTVDVRFVIDQGPSITFVFQGGKVPKAVQEDIRQIWIRGFAETSSLRQSENRLLRYLRDEGYLQVKLSARDESPNAANRRFVFDISLGPQLEKPRWVFKGIEPIDLNVTTGAVLEDPKAIQERIQDALWRDGYLNASCSEPRLVVNGLNGRETRFEISVERGPRYSIGKVSANDPRALRALSETAGVFTQAWLDRARQSIVGKFWEDGFNDVQVTAQTHIPETGTTVDVDFKIDPGERQIVSKIEVEGSQTTDPEFIKRRFTFKEGDPVDYSRVNLTRKNLYDTRLFRRVDLNVVQNGDGYIARTILNEKPPWNFRYGFAVTDQLQTSDREFGVTADLSYSNLLGRGITTGTSLKYTPDTREARIFGSIGSAGSLRFFGLNATTTGAVFRTRDLTIPESITDLLGFTVQQQWKLRNRYLLSYDYSYKRNHTFDKNLDPNDPFAFDLTIPIARLNGTLSRDTRDDILNAAKGTFLSNSFEIAPPGVGSSIQFLRNYAQFLRFQPIRERLVWATGFRAGLAKGFHGQQLIPTEQFRAGGGTTLRAFQQDKLATPGDALFIVNQELRFPLLWRFSGVSFLDAGNIYPSISGFSPLRLRYSPGAGIRIQTPLVLIRLDLGLNVAPRPSEPRYRFAFGVGQAF